MSKSLTVLLFISIAIFSYAQNTDFLGIQEAVFRYQIKFAPPDSTFCLGAGFGKFGRPVDIDREMLMRLKDQPVKAASQCESNPDEQNIYLVTTNVELTRSGDAIVASTIYLDSGKGSSGFYTLRQENGIWTVKDFSNSAIRKLPE